MNKVMTKTNRAHIDEEDDFVGRAFRMHEARKPISREEKVMTPVSEEKAVTATCIRNGEMSEAVKKFLAVNGESLAIAEGTADAKQWASNSESLADATDSPSVPTPSSSLLLIPPSLPTPSSYLHNIHSSSDIYQHIYQHIDSRTLTLGTIKTSIMVPQGMPKIVDKVLEKQGFMKYNLRAGKPTKTLNSRTLSLKERILQVMEAATYMLIRMSRDVNNDSETPESIIHSSSDITFEINDLQTISYIPIELPLSYNYLQDILGCSNRSMTQLMAAITSSGLLVKVKDHAHEYIDWDKQQTDLSVRDHRQCSRYYASGQCYRRLVAYEIKSPKIKSELDGRRAKAHLDNIANDNYKKLIEDIPTRYEFPTIEYVIEKSHALVAEGRKTKSGKIYVYGDDKRLFTGDETTVTSNGKKLSTVKKSSMYASIDTGIGIYERFLTQGLYFKDSSKVGKETRYYTSLSLIPSWIRGMIRIDGKPIIENDFTALHSRLANYAYSRMTGNQPIPELTGDSHARLANKLGVPRDEAKLIGLSYWNSKINFQWRKTSASPDNAKVFAIMDSWLQTEHPDFWKWLLTIKRKDHKQMSKLLMKLERQLMDKVVDEENLMAEPYIYCYDCLYLTRKIDINKYLED